MSAAYYNYRHPRRDNRAILIAIALSILLHLIILFLAEQAPQKAPENEKIKIKYLPPEPEKKVQAKSDLPSQIIETKKPDKKEKPMSERLLSEFDSKGHFTEGKKSNRSESSKTVVPLNKPKGAEKEQKKAVEQPAQKETVKKQEKRPIKKKGPSLREKQEKAKEAKKQKQVSPLFAKNTQEMQKGAKQGFEVNKALPFLDGAELAELATVETGSEDLSDSDTISLDTKNYKYFSYFNHIKRKIELVWEYPKEAGMRGMSGRLQLKFTLRKDGELLKVVLLHSTGYKLLDEAAMEALRAGGPYNPFPKTITKEKINIIANFVYFPSYQVLRGR